MQLLSLGRWPSVLAALSPLITSPHPEHKADDHENHADGENFDVGVKDDFKRFTSGLSLATVSASAVKSAIGDGPDILSP